MNVQSRIADLVEMTGPIDRVAARVARPAAPENVWQPPNKGMLSQAFSANLLEIAPIPAACRHMAEIIGRRRSRLVIVGYAKEQGSKGKPAKWVARCDCGNFVHRTTILRWLGTDAYDACQECRDRAYRIGKRPCSSIPAQRATVNSGGAVRRAG